MIRIMIVDDHVLFREGLAAILHEPDLEVAGLAGSVSEAVEMARTLQPDIILMDFNMPDGTGADATRKILQEAPQCKVLFLTISEDDESLFSAIRSGAKGYLLKNIHPSKLISSLRAVYQGESALSRDMTLRLMEEFSRIQNGEQHGQERVIDLTQREVDVLRELATGKSNHEIASQLFLSENTVKYHVHSILEKLNLPDRRSAARYASSHGLV